MEKLNNKNLEQATGGIGDAANFKYVQGYHEGDSCPDCGEGILHGAFLPHMLECSKCKHTFERAED